MCIISGATENTGSAVAKALLERYLPVRVIVRSRESSVSIEKLGAVLEKLIEKSVENIRRK